MKIPNVEIALKAGCKLHAFRSGGGLRVFRLERNQVLKGYGEHPSALDALVHLDEDYAAGGREYKTVYGVKYPHYLTGTSSAGDSLDQWILNGRNVDAEQSGDDVLVRLSGLVEDERVPNTIQQSVISSGKPQEWKNRRGFTYSVSPFRFPGNGEMGVSLQVIYAPKGKKEHLYRIRKEGIGKTFFDALEKAFDAEEIEE